ncbi:transferrin receptor protein 2 [Lepisosteus oculatus]|uniref:transferrin receptor protein 2 n=1 Tax=Lepisosteus oculatus TaxID=7918 RepID=UPI00371DF958
MDTVRSLLSGHSNPAPQTSCSIYRQRRCGRGLEEGDGEEGGDCRVEMKLVESEAEEDLEPGLTSDITALVLRKPRDRRRAGFYLALITLLIFTTAFLLGYVTFRGSCYSCEESEGELVPVDDSAVLDSSSEDGVLYLGELREMLRKYLKEETIGSTVGHFSRMPHPPGSLEGNSLATEVLEFFRQLKMDHTWTDSHFANLQFPSRTQPNTLSVVDRNGNVIEQIQLERPLDSYCAYSGTGTVKGGLVYVNYGRREDFELVQSLGVPAEGNVVIVRVGQLSFAEKVANAQQAGAVGVLIYPDPADVPQDPRRLGLDSSVAISEHVHMGTGDPFTPGFPSFNHTQFPPTKSSGLPSIPALPISANVASKLLSQLSGPVSPRGWQGRLPYVRYALGPGLNSGDGRQIRLGVYNSMSAILLNNIFSSIEGYSEPDQYIIIGAQRDSWDPGAAKSAVGTAILMELARTFSAMVQNGFQPRRSLLFVSWDAGDFGSVGATEWLEGYLSMLHLKAIAYFSLDRAVLGDDKLSVYSSPLLAKLVEVAMNQVEHPKHAGQTINSYTQSQGSSWGSPLVKPLFLNSGAYSFTAFAGVPAMELQFTEEARPYPFTNTPLDTADRLQEFLQGRLPEVALAVAELVGQMALRLAHDHIVPLDFPCYSETTLQFSAQLSKYSAELQERGLSPHWVFTARGDYNRAAEKLRETILNSDVQDDKITRLYNMRIMRVEYYFLSQYVSAVETPFRHVLHGRGDHTLSALTEHLALLRSNPEKFDEARFRKQLALLTWTLQGAANALSGDVWNIDNLF